MRQRYPDWGARKLQVLLAREQVELTRSTIHRVLLRHDLVRDRDRHPQAAVADLNGVRPTSCGRWTSRVRKAGTRRSVHCRCWIDHSRYLLVLQRGVECARRVGARATGDGLCQLWCAGSHADGSRYPMVECAGADGRHAIDSMADEARDPAAFGAGFAIPRRKAR